MAYTEANRKANKKYWQTKKDTRHTQLNISLEPAEKDCLIAEIKAHRYTQVGFIRTAYLMLVEGYFEQYEQDDKQKNN